MYCKIGNSICHLVCLRLLIRFFRLQIFGNYFKMGCCGSSENEYWAADDKEITREEDRVEGNIKYKVGDFRFVEMEKWPVVLMDTTGSMTLTCEKNDPKPRKQLVYETMWQIMQMLIPINTADESGINTTVNLLPQQALLTKGIPLITFNAMEGGIYRGLLHPNNFINEFNKVRWHGGTHIMDGWRKMLQCYENQFSDRPQSQWPLLLALIITDGELQDGKEFEQHLKNVKGRIFVEIAVVGYGEDHDRALRHYNKIAKSHDHVRVTAFTDNLDPTIICKRLISLIDPKAVQQINSNQLMLPSLSDYNGSNVLNYNPNVVNFNNNAAFYNPNINFAVSQPLLTTPTPTAPYNTNF